MATEYKLSYTAEDIDKKLGKIDDTILSVPQTLTDDQKAQARENIEAAHAKTIVDQSLEEEWEGGYVFNNDCPCQFWGWKWKKYIDGTFTLLGLLCNASIYAEDEPQCPLVWETNGEEVPQETDLPFDAYDAEVTCWWEGTSENSDFAEITVNVNQEFAPAWLFIEAYASAETRERMRAEGIEIIKGNIYVSITGKWRVD